MPSLKIVAKPKDGDGHQDDVQKLLFFQGNLYSGDYKGNLKKWSPDLKLLCAWKGHDWAVEDLAGDDVNGGRIFSSDCDGQIKEWNPSQPDQCRNTYTTINPESKKRTNAKALATHGGLLYAADDAGIVRRFQPNFVKDREKYTYTEIWSLRVSADPLLPDHPLVFTARNNAVLVSDVSELVDKEGFRETLAVRGSFQGSAPIEFEKDYFACKDKDGSGDLSLGMSFSVGVNNLDRKFEKITTIKAHEMILNALALDNDGCRVVSSGWDGKVKLWDFNSSKELSLVQNKQALIEYKTF